MCGCGPRQPDNNCRHDSPAAIIANQGDHPRAPRGVALRYAARILELARRLDLRIIEDCAQAHGAKYHGKHVGTFGDIGVYSFCQDKIMTTGGEGGMLVTNNKQVWKKAWSYKDHGKCYEAAHSQDHPPGFRWLHKSFGSNWRMTEMQAAMGRTVLRKLDGWVETRRRNAECLRQLLSRCPHCGSGSNVAGIPLVL